MNIIINFLDPTWITISFLQASNTKTREVIIMKHVAMWWRYAGILFHCMYTYVCMYVCMHVCMYVCMYVHVYVCTYIHMYGM